MDSNVVVLGMLWKIVSRNERETKQNGRTFFACRCKSGAPWIIIETVENKEGVTVAGVTMQCQTVVAEHREGYPDTKALTEKVLELIGGVK